MRSGKTARSARGIAVSAFAKMFQILIGAYLVNTAGSIGPNHDA